MLTVAGGVIVGIAAWRLMWNAAWRVQFYIHDRHSEALGRKVGNALNWLSN